MILKIPATIHKITTLADKGLKLEVYTQELSEEGNASVFKLHDKLGVFCFAEGDIKQEDLQELPEVKLEKWEKSPSQRLRAVIYRLWEQAGSEKTFEEFYREYMEKLIERIKEKLV